MKNFLLALMVVLTTCTLAIAQNQTTVVRDSVGKVKVTVTKDNKANTNNTAVTVIGVDTADADSADVNANSSNVSTTHGKASFTFDSDDSDFPFHNVSAGGGILVAIIAIIAVFGFPVFILFVIFFFRYAWFGSKYKFLLNQGTGTCCRPTASGRVYPRKQNSRFAFTRHQEHLYGYRSFHLPLGNHRRIRNWRYRTACHVYGTGTMADRLQATCQRGNQEQRNRHQKQRHHHLGEERRREERRK